MSFYRARLVNYIKPSEVIRQPYPLQIRASGPQSYFMKRETWGWTDFLMNPMVKKIDVAALNMLNIYMVYSLGGRKMSNSSKECRLRSCGNGGMMG